MRKIIEAISILGGQEAEEYLSFVAATHDDDEIRAPARARLQRASERPSAPLGPAAGLLAPPDRGMPTRATLAAARCQPRD